MLYYRKKIINHDISNFDDCIHAFFQNLLGRTVDGKLCRYTSRENLFMILDTQQNMCCVVFMNDKGESNYFDDKISIQYESVPDDSNNCFIMSLLRIEHEDEDELTYWRLYGG